MGSALEWLTLIATTIGLIAVFMKIGKQQGTQEEKNSTMERDILQNKNDLKDFEICTKEDISFIKKDINDIKQDISELNGQLKGAKIINN